MTAADLTEEEMAVVQQFRRLKAMQSRAAIKHAREQAADSTAPQLGEQLIANAERSAA